MKRLNIILFIISIKADPTQKIIKTCLIFCLKIEVNQNSFSVKEWGIPNRYPNLYSVYLLLRKMCNKNYFDYIVNKYSVKVHKLPFDYRIRVVYVHFTV